MSANFQQSSVTSETSKGVLEQIVEGSRRNTNYFVGGMLSIGGIGFLVASLSSFLGKDLLPLGNPSGLIFVPQGLIMGLYGIAAIFAAIYFWTLIAIDFGSGFNRFDKDLGLLVISRRGIFKKINLEIPLKDVKAIKIEVREGFNPLRRISLRLNGRKDLPITRAGQIKPLVDLEQEGAELARFLGVNLEGL